MCIGSFCQSTGREGKRTYPTHRRHCRATSRLGAIRIVERNSRAQSNRKKGKKCKETSDFDLHWISPAVDVLFRWSVLQLDTIHRHLVPQRWLLFAIFRCLTNRSENHRNTLPRWIELAAAHSRNEPTATKAVDFSLGVETPS